MRYCWKPHYEVLLEETSIMRDALMLACKPHLIRQCWYCGLYMYGGREAGCNNQVCEKTLVHSIKHMVLWPLSLATFICDCMRGY